MPIPQGLGKNDKAGARFGLFRADLATKGVSQALIDEYLPIGTNPQEFTNKQLADALTEVYKRLPKAA